MTDTDPARITKEQHAWLVQRIGELQRENDGLRARIAGDIEAEAERTSAISCHDWTGMGPDFWQGMYEAARIARGDA